MSKKHIEAFALPFHLEKSKSHEILVTRPLAPFLSFTFRAWEGTYLPYNPNKKEPLLFFQYPPPTKLLENNNNRLVWIPMWDHIRNYSQKWWSSLPKTLKIVAFSKAVKQKADTIGLENLQLNYYVDPQTIKKATWNQGNILYYWNRRGLYSANDIKRICRSLKIKKLIIRNHLDPSIHKNLTIDIKSFDQTEVVIHNNFLSARQYHLLINESNIYLSPRTSEGVGLSFLEAYARGCLVLAFDAPTMNEYITHKFDGFLFRSTDKNPENFNLKRAIKIRLPQILGGINYLFDSDIDWESLEKLKPQEIGNNAFLKNKLGYTQWVNQGKDYASFILGKSIQ